MKMFHVLGLISKQCVVHKLCLSIPLAIIKSAIFAIYSFHTIMQQDIVLQPNSEGLAQAGAFVERTCDELHLFNEFGVISVAVLQAVGMEIAAVQSSPVSIKLSCGHCMGGVYFDISHYAVHVDFSVTEEASLYGDAASVFMIKKLADCVSLRNEGSLLHLEFHVAGIDALRATSRQDVLQKFYMHDVVSA